MRIWRGRDGELITDEQVIRHIAAFGSLSAALREHGDITLLADPGNAKRSAGRGKAPRLADYIDDDTGEDTRWS